MKNLESLNRDDNNTPIMTGTGILTQDATGTPQTSPLAYTTGVVTIAIPENAAEMVFRASTDIRVSNVSDVSTYFVVPAGANWVIGLARTDTLYFQRDATSGTLNFYFVTV